nr:transposase [uncultured Pedobacter sp.]
MEQVNGTTRQRTMRSEEQILLILEEYDKSGFNVKDFCEVSDINEATFYSWIKKYRSKPEEPAGFAQIEVIPTFNSRPTLFAEVGNIKLYKEVPAEYLKTLLI